MERLTGRINGVVVYVGAKNPYSTGQIPCEVEPAGVREMMDRLAAYEDTGLTPEEAKRMSNILMDVGIDYNCSWEYVKNWLLDDRLRELAEADKDGRLVVLPCKPDGSMLNTSDPERPEIMKRIHFAVAYVCGGIVFHQPYNIFIENVAAGYIRPLNEEAEKALEAMKDE